KVPSRWASKLGGASAGIINVRMPPYFGVSPAAAGTASAAAPRIAAAVARLNSTRASRYLFVQPDRCQVLTEIMTWADFPALHICAMRYHPIPPQEENLVCFGVEHVFLEVAHQRPLPRRVGLAQHLVVEIDLLRVLEVSVVCGIN